MPTMRCEFGCLPISAPTLQKGSDLLWQHNLEKHRAQPAEVKQLASVSWRDRALEAVRALVNTGEDFTFYQLADYGIEDPPDARHTKGQFAKDVHTLGIAHPVGYKKSDRPGTKASATAIWSGNAGRCDTCKAKAAAA